MWNGIFFPSRSHNLSCWVHRHFQAGVLCDCETCGPILRLCFVQMAGSSRIPCWLPFSAPQGRRKKNLLEIVVFACSGGEATTWALTTTRRYWAFPLICTSTSARHKDLKEEEADGNNSLFNLYNFFKWCRSRRWSETHNVLLTLRGA